MDIKKPTLEKLKNKYKICKFLQKGIFINNNGVTFNYYCSVIESCIHCGWINEKGDCSLYEEKNKNWHSYYECRNARGMK